MCGLAISRVASALTAGPFGDHNAAGGFAEIARASGLGDSAFGFHNHSQQSVRYSGVFEDVDVDFCTTNPNHPNCIGNGVSAPAPLLLGMGLVGLAYRRYRDKR